MSTFDKPFGDTIRQQLPKRRQDAIDQQEAASKGDVKRADPLCSICHGAGAYVWASTREGPWRQQELQICDCIYGRRNPERTTRILGNSGVEEQRDLTFANLRPLQGTATAWNQARTYARDPLSMLPWLLLVGPNGSGKTTMAQAIANERVDQAHPVIFRLASDLIRLLKETFDRSSEVRYADRFDEFRTTPLLIIDELGRQAHTEFNEGELYDLLNHRWLHRKPTVITTNMHPRLFEGALRARLTDTTVCTLVPVPDEVAR